MRMKRNSITNIPAPTTPCGPLQFCPSSLFLRTISLPDIVYTMLLPFLCFYYQVQAYTAHPKRGQLIKRQVAGARYSDFAENSQKEKMVDQCPKEPCLLSQNSAFFYTERGGSKVLVLVRLQKTCANFSCLAATHRRGMVWKFPMS